MTLEVFLASLDAATPAENTPALLRALWYDRKGDWERAHEIAQDVNTATGAQVHAYLHRKEGDIWNADYWYRRAGVGRPEASLDAEWHDMVKMLVNA